MSRAVPEWIAKHPDQKVPPRVRLRVFDAHNGTCHISGRKISAGEKWELEHVKALVLGGEHRESNLAPALVGPHRKKTALDVAEKASVSAKRQKHIGIKRPSKLSSPREPKPAMTKTLPPKQLYRSIEQS